MQTPTEHFDPYLRRARKLSIASLVTGILAFLPYFCWIVSTLYNWLMSITSDALFNFLASLEPIIQTIETITLAGCFSGAVFGFIALLTGILALRQLVKGEGKQERRLAIAGIVLGGLAVAFHILFYFAAM